MATTIYEAIRSSLIALLKQEYCGEFSAEINPA